MTLTEEEASKIIRITRHISAARTLLQAGADEYAKALSEDRLAAWEKMMHSIVDLLANVEPQEKRKGQPVTVSPSSASLSPPLAG